MTAKVGPHAAQEMFGVMIEELRQEILRNRLESYQYEQQRQQDSHQIKQSLASIQQNIRSSEFQTVPYHSAEWDSNVDKQNFIEKVHNDCEGRDARQADVSVRPSVIKVGGAACGQDMERPPDELAPSQVDVAQEVGQVSVDDMKIWNELSAAVTRSTRDAYENIISQHKESVWHALFRHLRAESWVFKEMPKDAFASVTETRMFMAFQMLLILSNTGIMCYETDLAIKAALQDPPGDMPDWLEPCNLTFNMLFLLELIFRICVLRTWFLVSPQDWAWNMFDVFVVATSLINEFLGGVNLSFIRTFRLLRAVRALRLVRVLRFFAELRKILVAIVACLASLLWCFVFLFVVMFLFAILLLQGIAADLNSLNRGSEEYFRYAGQAREWYGSLGDTVVTLLASVTTGNDFFVFTKPLVHAGVMYPFAYVAYMLFVTVGVMNVLTGVFLSSADLFADRHLVISTEQIRDAQFVKAMTEVFEEEDRDSDGFLEWYELKFIMQNANVAAYLQSFGLTITHARFIFDVLDESCQGKVRVHEFVMGMLRMKGDAKIIDSCIIQRQIHMLPELFGGLLRDSNKGRL